jgi:hypothetical protein
LQQPENVPTLEALAATSMLRNDFSDIKIRFVNVLDLFKLQPNTEHPHGLRTGSTSRRSSIGDGRINAASGKAAAGVSCGWRLDKADCPPLKSSSYSILDSAG